MSSRIGHLTILSLPFPLIFNGVTCFYRNTIDLSVPDHGLSPELVDLVLSIAPNRMTLGF